MQQPHQRQATNRTMAETSPFTTQTQSHPHPHPHPEHSPLGHNTATEDIYASVKSLLEKERQLFEIELLRKDREICRLKQSTKTLPQSNTNGDHAALAGNGLLPPVNALAILQDPAYLERLSFLDLSQANVSETAIYELGKILPHLPNVTGLDLSDNSIGDSMANSLVVLLTASRLKVFSVENNYLGLQAGLAICRAVVQGNSITDLNMSDNPMRKQPEAGKALSRVLCGSRSLRRLTVTMVDPKRDRDSGTFRGQAASFVNQIVLAPAIESLALVHASLSAVALKALAKEVLKCLVELDLSNAFIGSKGAAVLAMELGRDNTPQNPLTLKKLTLSMNAIGNGGARSLSRALKVNTTLTNLGLNSNNITARGLESLTSALQRNRRVKHLSLERNQLDEDHTILLAFVRVVEAAGCRIESLGRLEHLTVPETTKARLSQILSARARRNCHGLESLEHMVRIYEQSQPKRYRVKAGQYRVEALRLEIPDIGFPSPSTAPLVVHVSWQTRHAWDLVKESSSGQEITTVASGDDTTMFSRTGGWRPDDTLTLCFKFPEKSAKSARTVPVDAVSVYAGACVDKDGCNDLPAEQQVGLAPALTVKHNTTEYPLDYVPVNEVELAEYAEGAQLVLRWSVSLGSEGGNRRYNKMVRAMGVDWKLEVAGTGYSFKMGNAQETSRLVNDLREYEVAIDYDREGILGVDDRIRLWMRPARELTGQFKRLLGGILPTSISCSTVELSMRTPSVFHEKS